MTEGISGQNLLDECNEIIIDLENLDEVIKDEHKAMIFLRSLPPLSQCLSTCEIPLSFDDLQNT